MRLCVVALQGGVLQYGHGLFGSRSEVNEGYLDNEANEHG